MPVASNRVLIVAQFAPSSPRLKGLSVSVVRLQEVRNSKLLVLGACKVYLRWRCTGEDTSDASLAETEL